MPSEQLHRTPDCPLIEGGGLILFSDAIFCLNDHRVALFRYQGPEGDVEEDHDPKKHEREYREHYPDNPYQCGTDGQIGANAGTHAPQHPVFGWPNEMAR